MIEFDYLEEYTLEEYEELRKRYPEDGSEHSMWQRFPKVPELNKTIITYDDSNPNISDIRFDQVILREPRFENDLEKRTYLRGHYFWDVVNYNIHYWIYAPEEVPDDIGYDVGD